MQEDQTIDVEKSFRRLKRTKIQVETVDAQAEDDDAFSQRFLCKLHGELKETVDVDGPISISSDGEEPFDPALLDFPELEPDPFEADYDVFGFPREAVFGETRHVPQEDFPLFQP